MILAHHDIVRHLMDPVFPFAQSLQGIDQIGPIGLLHVAFEQLGIALGAEC